MTSRARRFLSLVAAALVAAFASIQPAAQDAGWSAERTSRVTAAIAALQTKRHIPALSVAVVDNNRIRFSSAYGMTDVENDVSATPGSVFRIASVSKALTAVGAMRLVEQGKLDLDAPIQKYAPSFPVKPFPITTRQVLAHLSGIRNYRSGEGERTDHFDSLTDALNIFKSDPLDQQPGTKFAYTTFGYTLVGVIIEGASGRPFRDYMRENVLMPAGMASTAPDDLPMLIPNRVRGYTPSTYAVFDGNFANTRLMDSSYKLPGGGFVSTANDLAKFAIAVQTGKLITPATLQQMSVNQHTTDGKPTGYGYGWYVGQHEGGPKEESIWHGGVQPGFTSELWLLPKHGFAVAILANLEGGGILGLGSLAGQIADIVFDGRTHN